MSDGLWKIDPDLTHQPAHRHNLQRGKPIAATAIAGAAAAITASAIAAASSNAIEATNAIANAITELTAGRSREKARRL